SLHDALPIFGHLEESDPPSFETYASFRAANAVLEPVQATNQPQTLVSMVREGLGLGVTNRLAVLMTDTTGVRLRQIRAAHNREVAVCWVDDAGFSASRSEEHTSELQSREKL